MACKKPVTEPNAGIYRGTFFQIFDNGDTNAEGIVHLALSETDIGGNFNMSGDTGTGSPYTCYGTYVINNATQMTFENNANIDLGYQPHYVLDTIYNYVFDDHFFSLEFKDDTTLYEYNLKRD